MSSKYAAQGKWPGVPGEAELAQHAAHLRKLDQFVIDRCALLPARLQLWRQLRAC